MTGYELRPMSVGELLDGSIAIYRNSFPVLVAIGVVTQGVPTIINAYAGLSGGFVVNPGLVLLAVVLGGIGGLLAAGATVWVISEAYLGREADLMDSLKYALGRAWSLLVAGVIKYFLIGVGLILLVVPGIIVACGLAVASQVVVLERKGGAAAIGRSWDLTKGYRGKAFVLGIIVFFLFYLPVFAFGVLAAAIPSMETIFNVGGQVLGLLIYPIIVCAFTLYYYDLRVRKEAFDLELLNRELTGEYPVPA
ncbi:MAG TPA: hypothetical protein VGA22_00250 [Gemmatimonadales bacterium]